jgi:hypothetical protein
MQVGWLGTILRLCKQHYFSVDFDALKKAANASRNPFETSVIGTSTEKTRTICRSVRCESIFKARSLSARQGDRS